MTVRDQQLGYGKADTGARTSQKNFFHDVENGSGLREALGVATALIPILTIAPMQERPAQPSQYCASHIRDSSVCKMSLLFQCCR
jgi:hypothetical protein